MAVSTISPSHLDPVFQAQEHCRELHATLKELIQEGGSLSDKLNSANAAFEAMGAEAQALQQRKAAAEIEGLLAGVEIEDSAKRSAALRQSLSRLQSHAAEINKDHHKLSSLTANLSLAHSVSSQTLLDVDRMQEEFLARLQRTRRETRELEARMTEAEQQQQLAASFRERIVKKEAENTRLGVSLKRVEQHIKEAQEQLQIAEAELDWIVADHDELVTEKRKELDVRDAECAFLGGQVESLEEQMSDLTDRERTGALVTESLRETLKQLERR